MNVISRLLLCTVFVACSYRNSLAADTSPGESSLGNQGFTYQPKNVEKAKKPLKILILGGTGFTGPYQVKYALARGHTVTVFNRGKTHPGELPAGVEQLVGDRN